MSRTHTLSRTQKHLESLKISVLAICIGCLTTLVAQAGSATWNSSPASSDWFSPPNWTPSTVPNGPSDVATFDVFDVTSIHLSASASVASIIFNSGASSYK